VGIDGGVTFVLCGTDIAIGVAVEVGITEGVDNGAGSILRMVV
jgi:hypothetical protein